MPTDRSADGAADSLMWLSAVPAAGVRHGTPAGLHLEKIGVTEGLPYKEKPPLERSVGGFLL